MTIRYRRGALVLYMWPPESTVRRRATPWPGAWSVLVVVDGKLVPADVGRPAPAGPPAGARDRRD